MKLGILVVYLIREETQRLFDIHLSRIKRHTRAQYTIYAAINRLDTEYRPRIEQSDQIVICDCPTTDQRGAKEHSHYLEHLTQRAIADGATHVVTVHLDSFPIKTGWEEQLAQCLTERCVFVTEEHINTACLFFHRDFYLRYGPTFLLPEPVRESLAYAEYIERYGPFEHSGIGYGFTAYQNDLTWHYMRPTASDGAWATVYDNVFFHLRHATYVPRSLGAAEQAKTSQLYFKSVSQARSLWLSRIPSPLRRAVRRRYAKRLNELVEGPLSIHCREKLVEDPDGYIAELQRRSLSD